MNLSTGGITNRTVDSHAATAHRITGLTLGQLQLAGIHCRLEGSLNWNRFFSCFSFTGACFKLVPEGEESLPPSFPGSIFILRSLPLERRDSVGDSMISRDRNDRFLYTANH